MRGNTCKHKFENNEICTSRLHTKKSINIFLTMSTNINTAYFNTGVFKLKRSLFEILSRNILYYFTCTFSCISFMLLNLMCINKAIIWNIVITGIDYIHVLCTPNAPINAIIHDWNNIFADDVGCQIHVVSLSSLPAVLAMESRPKTKNHLPHIIE